MNRFELMPPIQIADAASSPKRSKEWNTARFSINAQSPRKAYGVEAVSRSVIVLEGAQRRQQVTCNSVGRDSASLLAELKRRITADVQLPHGVYAAYGGCRELLVHSTLAGVGIVLLLAIISATDATSCSC